MNGVDLKMFAKLLAENLATAAEHRFGLTGTWTHETVLAFCKERAANIAAQLDELIEQSIPPQWFKDEIAKLPASIENADRMVAILGGK